MAISRGNLELIRLAWGRLPEEDHEGRVDLLEVAADFHRPEPLPWLFRDAAVLDREVFAGLAIERRHGRRERTSTLAVAVTRTRPLLASGSEAAICLGAAVFRQRGRLVREREGNRTGLGSWYSRCLAWVMDAEAPAVAVAATP